METNAFTRGSLRLPGEMGLALAAGFTVVADAGLRRRRCARRRRAQAK
jgi:hypothetical protein